MISSLHSCKVYFPKTTLFHILNIGFKKGWVGEKFSLENIVWKDKVYNFVIYINYINLLNYQHYLEPEMLIV